MSNHSISTNCKRHVHKNESWGWGKYLVVEWRVSDRKKMTNIKTMNDSLVIEVTSPIRGEYFIYIKVLNNNSYELNWPLSVLLCEWSQPILPHVPSPQSSAVPPYHSQETKIKLSKFLQFEIYTPQFWFVSVLLSLFQSTFCSDFSVYFIFELISCQQIFIPVIGDYVEF